MPGMRSLTLSNVRSPGSSGRSRWSRPGPALREGLDNILHARTGALIAIGDAEELSFLLSGGIRLDVDYTPALLYQLAKMDGGDHPLADRRRRSTGRTSS